MMQKFLSTSICDLHTNSNRHNATSGVGNA